MEEIHFEVCLYRHNASMDATPPSNAMRPPPHRVLAAITNTLWCTRSTADDPICGKVWHTCAAKRYVQKLNIGRVHKFGMDRVRKFGIWARSELGIGHDVRRAFRTGGIRTWGCNRAVKTNRLVLNSVIICCVHHAAEKSRDVKGRKYKRIMLGIIKACYKCAWACMFITGRKPVLKLIRGPRHAILRVSMAIFADSPTEKPQNLNFWPIFRLLSTPCSIFTKFYVICTLQICVLY